MRHEIRERFRRPLPLHVTLRVRSDVPSLRTVSIVQEVELTFADGCVRPGFRLVHYSIQGDHAHLVVESHDQVALGRGMKAISSRLARAVNRVLARRGPVLADRYHSRLLPTPKQVRNALRYVLLNARHHLTMTRAMRRTRVLLDRASSARWFDGWRRHRLDTREDPGFPTLDERPPVARARTWLLTVGWRRHGLLDPADVPG